MIKKHSLVFIVTFFLVLLLDLNSVQAVTCGGRNAIGNSPPYWGDNASQNVTSPKGSQVRISIKGEDGCAGQTAQYQIKKGASIVSTVDVNLIKGSAVPGQQDVFILYGDWTISLSDGDYKVKLLKVGNKIFSSNDSGNNLTVGASQACNLDKVYANPNGGKPGDKVKATVEGKGSCLNWGATISINRTTGGTNTIIFSGSEQKFISGSNKLEWEWTLPALTAGSEQASYKIVAHVGSQNLESQTFLVALSGGGGGTDTGTCNNNGKCDKGETSFSCPKDKCPTTSGQPQTFKFTLNNPLQATNILDLINIITTWLFMIAIPIAVVMIVWAGVMFLTSRGESAKIIEARKILLYAVVGLAIILIGKGFITLIESILNLGKS